MFRTTLLLASVLTPVLGTGCGADKSPAPGGGDAPAGGGKPLPPEYRTLAGHLGYGLKPRPADFRNDKSLTDVLAEGHAAILDLRAVRSDDPDITYIAAQAAAAFSDAVARMERLNALPKPPPAGTVMVSSFVHGFFGNPYAGYELGADADRKQRAVADELTAATAAIEKADAAHQLLARVAEKYASPTRGDPARIGVDFDEAWNAWGPHDWCAVHNAGGDLADCTLVVELTGAGGAVRRNVHYVPKWPARSWLYARYEAGTEVNGRRFGRTTVPDVAALRVRVLAPGYTGEVSYTYAGVERSKDVARRVAEVKPHLRWRVRPSAWGATSGRVLVVENRWTHPVVQVGVRVVSATGGPVGEFVQPRLDPGGNMDVGSWQVSRNLTPGDRVTVRLGQVEVLSTVIE